MDHIPSKLHLSSTIWMNRHDGHTTPLGASLINMYIPAGENKQETVAKSNYLCDFQIVFYHSNAHIHAFPFKQAQFYTINNSCQQRNIKCQAMKKTLHIGVRLNFCSSVLNV